MQIPLPSPSPGERFARVVVPVVFILGGLGMLYWVLVHGERPPGWQGFVPVVVALGFVVSGGVSLYRTSRAQGAAEEARQRLEAHRDAPWRARPQWRESELVAPSPVDRSFLVFTVVWNLMAWPVTILVLSDGGGTSEGPVWLVALFPLVGLGMLGKVVADHRRGRKFGRTTLVVEPMPPRLGRTFQGTLRTSEGGDARFDTGIVVGVSCYRQYVRHTRDSEGSRRRSVERDLLWRDETRVSGGRDGGGTGLEVPFSFRIPEDLPPSHPLEVESRILWEVSARADLPGLDLDCAVEVPVFPPDDGTAGRSPEALPSASTPAPSDPSVPAESVGATEGPPAWPYPAPVTPGIELVERPGALELHFTAARTRKGALILGGVGVVVAVFGVAVLTSSILWGLGLLAVAGLLLFGSVQQATNDTALYIRDGGIEVTHDGIGMPSDVAFPVGNLGAVEVHLDPGGGSDRGYTISLVAASNEGLEALEDQVYRTADILSRLGMSPDHPAMDALEAAADRPRVMVASQLADKDEADWLAWKIREAARAQEEG